ncbi:MAG: hypothetical protein JW884_03700 [Deltaproteobacteria bacterium]|nr:hypothetical protein [Deltaproteobacteria bacterium]
MNIFVLDRNIATCARYHADQHVVKMILEGTQMLCTVLHRHGIDAPYKPTHTKHPCTLWAGRSLANWLWLRDLTLALNLEFRYRFNGVEDHRSALVAKLLPLPPIAAIGLTEFEQVMPNTYKVPGNPVQAYRNFYVGEKSRFAAWTRRRLPRWYMESLRTAGRQKGSRLDSGPFR